MNILRTIYLNQYKKGSFLELCIYLVMIVFSFILPVTKFAISYIIGVLMILSIVRIIIQKGKNTYKLSPASLGCIIFYMLYVAGLIYTTDINRGIFDLEVKLSLIVFPLIFIFMGKNVLDKDKINTIKFAFVAGTLAGSLICLFHALYFSYCNYFTFDNFMYTRLSYAFHPSYFAMFLNLSIIILFIYLINYWTQIKMKKKLGMCFIILYLFIFIIFLNSKAGIIITVFTLFLLLAYLIIIRRKIIFGMIITGLFITVTAIVMVKTPYMMDRFKGFWEVVNPNNNDNIQQGNGTSDRILIWQNSLKVIKENLPFGVGTGDVRSALNQCYTENSFKEGADHNFNSHDQFLQTSVAIGIPGFVILLFFLIYLFAQGIKRRDFFTIFLIIIIFGNFLVESMLETQAGVVFTAFFIMLADFETRKDTNFILST
jgi:O-antigen ligase